MSPLIHLRWPARAAAGMSLALLAITVGAGQADAAARPATVRAPSTSSFGNTTAIAYGSSGPVIAAAGSDGSLNYWWKTYRATSWPAGNFQQVAPPGTTTNLPVIVNNGKGNMIADTTESGGMDTWWQANGASGWTTETVPAASGCDESVPAIVATPTGWVLAEWCGTSLDYWVQSPGSTKWTAGGKPVYTFPGGATHDNVNSVSLSESQYGGGTAVLTATDDNDNLRSWTLLNGSSTWAAETAITSTSATWYTNTAVTSTKTGDVMIAHNYSTDSLEYWWQSNGASSWTFGGQVTGSTGNYGLAGIYFDGNNVLVTAPYEAAGKYYIGFWSQPSGSGSWSAEKLPVAANANFEAAGVCDGASTDYVVATVNNTVESWQQTSPATSFTSPEVVS